MSKRQMLPIAAAVLAVAALSACSNTRSTTTTTTENGITETRTVRTEQPRNNRSNSSRSGSSSSSSNDHSGACTLMRGDDERHGRNVLYRCNGQRVLQTSEARQYIRDDVRVSFGGGGSIIRANVQTRQAANAANRSDEAACERAFINAVVKFQETTRRSGGSRVTNFHSYFDRQPMSGGQYICQVGTFHARVVMRGNIAR